MIERVEMASPIWIVFSEIKFRTGFRSAAFHKLFQSSDCPAKDSSYGLKWREHTPAFWMPLCGTMLNPVTTTGTPLGFPLTQAPSPRTFEFQ
ncbi:unnamed protein product [Calypogeia fissa]